MNALYRLAGVSKFDDETSETIRSVFTTEAEFVTFTKMEIE